MYQLFLGTHSIIAATVGFSLVIHGPYQGIYWWRILRIVSSWFISPLFAGIISGALFVIIRRYILDAQDPKQAALKLMPFLHSLTVFINVMSIFMYGTIIPGLVEKIPWWGVLFISFGIALLIGIGVHTFLVPWQRQQMGAIAAQKRDALLLRNLRSSVHLRAPASTVELSTIDEDVIQGLMRGGTVSFLNSRSFTETSLPRRESDTSLRGRGANRVNRNSLRAKHRAEKLRSVSEVEKSEFLLEVSAHEETDDSEGIVTKKCEALSTEALNPCKSIACPNLEACSRPNQQKTTSHHTSTASLPATIPILSDPESSASRPSQSTPTAPSMLYKFCPFKLNLDSEDVTKVLIFLF